MKRRDPHPCDNVVRQTINNKLSFQTTMNNIFHNIKQKNLLTPDNKQDKELTSSSLSLIGPCP